MSEEGDFYHTIPSVKAILPQNAIKLRANFQDSILDLMVQTDFQYPRHILKLIMKTGIRNGRLVHHLSGNVMAERKLNAFYALTVSSNIKIKMVTGFVSPLMIALTMKLKIMGTFI